jgi:hypothetical protein
MNELGCGSEVNLSSMRYQFVSYDPQRRGHLYAYRMDEC